jgi:hypothetical protein
MSYTLHTLHTMNTFDARFGAHRVAMRDGRNTYPSAMTFSSHSGAVAAFADAIANRGDFSGGDPVKSAWVAGWSDGRRRTVRKTTLAA